MRGRLGAGKRKILALTPKFFLCPHHKFIRVSNNDGLNSLKFLITQAYFNPSKVYLTVISTFSCLLIMWKNLHVLAENLHVHMGQAAYALFTVSGLRPAFHLKSKTLRIPLLK